MQYLINLVEPLNPGKDKIVPPVIARGPVQPDASAAVPVNELGMLRPNVSVEPEMILPFGSSMYMLLPLAVSPWRSRLFPGTPFVGVEPSFQRSVPSRLLMPPA